MAFNWFKQNKNDQSENTLSDQQKKIEKNDPAKSTGFFKRLKKGLFKTREILTTDIDKLFAGNRKIDDELLEELEELLITSDIGVKTTMDLIESISKDSAKISGPDQLKNKLKEEILSLLSMHSEDPLSLKTVSGIMDPLNAY